MKTSLLILISLIFIFPVRGQEKGQYIGICSDVILIAGSMDGTSWFQTDDEIILVPKPSIGVGAGLSYGFRNKQNIIDFGYYFSVQDYYTEEDGYAGRSSHHLVRYLGGKRFTDFSYGHFAAFYTDLDLAVIFSRFEKASYGLYGPPEYNAATFSALTLGFGGGCMFNLGEKFKLDLRMIPELYIGTDVRAMDSKRYPIRSFLNLMLLTDAGIIYYIK